jgi:hypothetical protein
VTDAQNKPLRVTSDSTTLRSRFGRVLVIAVWAILIAFIVGLIVEQNASWLLRYTPVIVLGGYVVWLLMWSPSVTIAPSGVTVRNLLRTNDVSWPAIQTVDTRFALTLHTAAGKIVAWSAPAPSRFAALRATRTELSGLPESSFAMGGIRPGDIPQTDSGLAALYVRRYWEQLRDAGYLESGAVEGTGVETHWLRRETVALLGLVVLSVLTVTLIPA